MTTIWLVDRFWWHDENWSGQSEVMVLLNALDQEVIVQKIESVVLIESSALKLCDGRINKKKKNSFNTTKRKSICNYIWTFKWLLMQTKQNCWWSMEIWIGCFCYYSLTFKLNTKSLEFDSLFKRINSSEIWNFTKAFEILFWVSIS